jgi:cysteine desulfurase
VAAVDIHGRVRPESLRELLPGAVLLSVQLANNEIGTVQDVRAFGALAKAAGAAFHIDATQGAGKVEFDMDACLADMVSLAAHKMHGPKGGAALIVAPGVELRPILYGGDQERGLWPGTHNVPAIVGLGEACRIGRAERDQDARRIGELRNLLAELLFERVNDLRVVGPSSPAPAERRWLYWLPEQPSVRLPGVCGRELVERLADRVCFDGAARNCPRSRPRCCGIGVRAEEAGGGPLLSRRTTRAEVGDGDAGRRGCERHEARPRGRLKEIDGFVHQRLARVLLPHLAPHGAGLLERRRG